MHTVYNYSYSIILLTFIYIYNIYIYYIIFHIPYIGTYINIIYNMYILYIYVYIYYIYIIYKNFRKSFSFHETHARRPRGGLPMGRTAEGRSELAELADDSASSADATIPPSPRGARSMTGR